MNVDNISICKEHLVVNVLPNALILVKYNNKSFVNIVI
uniref:Uncharacterized protein n=1 Tax=Geladintestivirus 4 TaxID=3233136 RepID=A0AAU8MGV8_9CAUD